MKFSASIDVFKKTICPVADAKTDVIFWFSC